MTENFRLSSAFLDEVDAMGDRRDLMVSDIFFPMPRSWGYRGDPYLWSAIAAFNMCPLSLTDDFESEFLPAFRHFTGHNFHSAPEEFRLEAFAHGGMSGGMIAMEWWRETGLPLLQRRYSAVRGAIAESAKETAPD